MNSSAIRSSVWMARHRRSRELSRSAGKQRQQLEWRVGGCHATSRQHRVGIDPLTARVDDARERVLDVDVRIGGADQQQIAARRPATSCPGETPTRTSATIDLQVGGADVVGVRPLAEQAVGLEPRSRRLEELAGEERRDAGHPRVRRLGDDHVVAPRRQQQVRPAVADDQPDARRARGRCRSRVEEAPTPRRPPARSRRRRRGAPSPVAIAEPTVTPLPRPMTQSPADGRGSGPAARRAAAASACRRRSRRRPCRRWRARQRRPSRRTLTVAAAPSL